jgi:hypothetical protein
MHRRFIASILLALVLAGSLHVTMAARPLLVVCLLPDASDLFIVVDNFGGVGGAVRQCVHFWGGLARGVER